MEGITLINDFAAGADRLFAYLADAVNWDTRMAARKTASFGVAYNYSQISYPYQPFLPELDILCAQLVPVVGFTPNNCLVNYYPDGSSKMGYHSDQTDILATGTGIAIVSLGSARILRFRNIADPSVVKDIELLPGSLFYMTQQVQAEWQHALPAADTAEGRISLTFREMR